MRCVGGGVTDMRALWEWEIAALAEVPHTEHNAATSALVLCIVVEFGKSL